MATFLICANKAYLITFGLVQRISWNIKMRLPGPITFKLKMGQKPRKEHVLAAATERFKETK